MDSRSDQQNEAAGAVGQWVELFAASEPESGASLKKKWDIAAELGSKGAEPCIAHTLSREHRNCQKNRGCVGRSPAEARSRGNPLLQNKMNVCRDFHLLQNEPGGPFHKIVGNVRGAFDLDLRPRALFEANYQLVSQRNGLEYSAEFVEPIRTLIQD